MLLVHSFAYFARVNFRPFSLCLDARDWMRLVIVAPPGHFISFIWFILRGISC